VDTKNGLQPSQSGETKTEAFSAFSAAMMLFGMLSQTDDSYKFYALLCGGILLIMLGGIARIYMKKLNLQTSSNKSSQDNVLNAKGTDENAISE